MICDVTLAHGNCIIALFPGNFGNDWCDLNLLLGICTIIRRARLRKNSFSESMSLAPYLQKRRFAMPSGDGHGSCLGRSTLGLLQMSGKLVVQNLYPIPAAFCCWSGPKDPWDEGSPGCHLFQTRQKFSGNGIQPVGSIQKPSLESYVPLDVSQRAWISLMLVYGFDSSNPIQIIKKPAQSRQVTKNSNSSVSTSESMKSEMRWSHFDGNVMPCVTDILQQGWHRNLVWR